MNQPRRPVVVITGASQGIGAMLCEAFDAASWRVMPSARSVADVNRLRERWTDAFQLDVDNDAHLNSAKAAFADKPVDLLINNAGIPGDARRLEHVTRSELLQVFSTDTAGPLLVTRAFLPSLHLGSLKRVVNISSRLGSLSGWTPISSYSYRIAKAGLNMATRCLAGELAEHGIAVIAVSPGRVRTRITDGNAPVSAETAAAGILNLCLSISPEQSGGFFNLDGSQHPW